jgi:signal recognition particle GTPase
MMGLRALACAGVEGRNAGKTVLVVSAGIRRPANVNQSKRFLNRQNATFVAKQNLDAKYILNVK